MKLSVSLLVAAATLFAATAQAQQMGEDAGISRAQRDSARLPWTGADVQFMQGMIHHHAQAIDMCKWAPTHGASAQETGGPKARPVYIAPQRGNGGADVGPHACPDVRNRQRRTTQGDERP